MVKLRMRIVTVFMAVAVVVSSFASVLFRELTTGAVSKFDVDVEIDFKETDLSFLNEQFTSYSFKGVNTASPQVTAGKPSDDFTCQSGKYGRGYLMPGQLTSDTNYLNYSALTYSNWRFNNFRAEYDFYFGSTPMGIAFGAELGAFPFSRNNDSSDDTGAVVCLNPEYAGAINIGGGIDVSSFKKPNETSAVANYSPFEGTNNLRYWYMTGDVTENESLYRQSSAKSEDFVTDTDQYYTACVEVNNGLLSVWIKGFEDRKNTIELLDYKGGYVSFVWTSNNKAEGSVSGIRLLSLDKDGPNRSFSYEADFDTLKLDDADKQMTAYYFETRDSAGVKGKVSDYWNLNNPAHNGQATQFRNNYLKPNHRKGDGNTYALCTYEEREFTDFEATEKYIINHCTYGIMIAPKGEVSSEQSGLSVNVSGSGQIRISGQIDDATAVYNGEGSLYTSKNYVSTPALKELGYISCGSDSTVETNSTSYTLKVKVSGGKLTAYIEEFSDFIITVNVTEEYNGGVFSLYSDGCDHGAFKYFKVGEVEEDDSETADLNNFTRLNKITALDYSYVSYRFENKDALGVKSKPSAQWTVDKGNNPDNLYPNNGLKPNISVTNPNTYTMLTDLGKGTVKNLKVEVQYYNNTCEYGFNISEMGTLVLTSQKGIYLAVNGNGEMIIVGAIDLASAVSVGSTSKTEGNTLIVSKTEQYELPSAEADDSVKSAKYTLCAEINNGVLTAYVKELSQMSVKVKLLNTYSGGVFSLVSTGGNNGGFIKYTLNTDVKPSNFDITKDTLEYDLTGNITKVNDLNPLFDGYSLTNAAVTTEKNKLTQSEISSKWEVNANGFITRKSGTGNITNDSIKNLEILTFKKAFCDFELTYTYQQNNNQVGIILGAEKGYFPLKIDSNGTKTLGGAIFWLDKSGNRNIRGEVQSAYTNQTACLINSENPRLATYLGEHGNPTGNILAKKEHTITIVVHNRELYVYADGEECVFNVKLSENYSGGYVSLFTTAAKSYGIKNIKISNRITKQLPSSSGFKVEGNKTSFDFSVPKLDTRFLDAFYAKNAGRSGNLQSVDFASYWSNDKGYLYRPSNESVPSVTEDLSIITYSGKEYKDFSATVCYQNNNSDLMMMFGTCLGNYAVTTSGASKISNGAVVYAGLGNDKANMYANGAIKLYNDSERPQYSKSAVAVGVTETGIHKLTVTVINGYCTVNLDAYGTLLSFEMSKDYNGGYISLVSNKALNKGFISLEITDLSKTDGKLLVSAENPRDITVIKGTDYADIDIPETVKGTLKNGKTFDINVSWDGTDYKPESGIYKISGTLENNDGYINEGSLYVNVNIRVKDSIEEIPEGTKYWNFDTDDDLRDFAQYYITDAKKGTDADGAKVGWFTDNGKLTYDPNRSIQGSESTELKMLTYKERTFKNFELQVDYTQHYSRMIVLFGSKNKGQYIDFSNPKSKDNPMAVYLEFEGNRNVMGNVINTDYYKRTDTQVPLSRETPVTVKNYYNAQDKPSSIGNKHSIKIKLLDDTVSIWVDSDPDNEFSAQLGEGYTGGYISLVSATAGGYFDNLKITPLSDMPQSATATVAATLETDGIPIDKNASAEISPFISKLYSYSLDDIETEQNSGKQDFDFNYNSDSDFDFYGDSDDGELIEDDTDDGTDGEEETEFEDVESTKKVRVKVKKKSKSAETSYLWIYIVVASVVLAGVLTVSALIIRKNKLNRGRKL